MAPNPIALHRFGPTLQLSQFALLSGTTHLPSKYSTPRCLPRISCQCSPNPDPLDSSSSESASEAGPREEKAQASNATQNNVFPEFPTKDINRRVALGSVVGAVGLFLSSRLDFGVSLKDLSAAAMPYERALTNGKPTVVEFYADWCEVCRELAPDVYKVEQQYMDRVNFVMLNVDNTKWEQELDEFGVEGIPHFAFLDRNGNEEGNVVGRLPKQYLLENVDALARGETSIPHSRVVGQFSSAESRKTKERSARIGFWAIGGGGGVEGGEGKLQHGNGGGGGKELQRARGAVGGGNGGGVQPYGVICHKSRL